MLVALTQVGVCVQTELQAPYGTEDVVLRYGGEALLGAPVCVRACVCVCVCVSACV